jgi:hypothetical protein
MAVQGAAPPDDLTLGLRYDRRRLRPESDLVPGEPGPAVDKLVRQALGRHMLLGELALVCTWCSISSPRGTSRPPPP